MGTDYTKLQQRKWLKNKISNFFIKLQKLKGSSGYTYYTKQKSKLTDFSSLHSMCKKLFGIIIK